MLWTKELNILQRKWVGGQTTQRYPRTLSKAAQYVSTSHVTIQHLRCGERKLRTEFLI